MAQSVMAALMIGHLFHISNLSQNLTLGLTIFRTFFSPRLLIIPRTPYWVRDYTLCTIVSLMAQGMETFLVAKVRIFFLDDLNQGLSPINTDWSLTYRLMYILEIRWRGSMVAELSKLTYVED